MPRRESVDEDPAVEGPPVEGPSTEVAAMEVAATGLPAEPASAAVDPGPTWLRTSVAPKLHLTAKSCRAFFEGRLAEEGATFAAWTVLAALKLEGPMIQRALARYLGIEGPTLSRQLEQMERRGLVVRRRTDTDRRAATVELAPDGEAMYARISAVAVRSQQEMLQGLSDGDVAQLAVLLDRILGNVGAG
ncbi:MarR family winged helix-turn-helix transcriptional regulator [Kitasatospora sp. NBC_00458]|uniref:MarR family winged helix-turn-helix transcriptional regulator n=1 Tax=Kitasatospora sp. NBC_00458 TaxID=2903568 RepID=UPI002E181D10